MLLYKGGFFAEAAFHAQQAAEKALKALLIALDVQPPRTHNIRRLIFILRNKGLEENPITGEEADILTSYAVEARYPDFEEEPGQRGAEDAIAIANRIIEWVVEKLKGEDLSCNHY